ncbi:MAG TPA: class I SAM-dependent methyltransferase [Planctomycetota bacterium]|nr:class I SAM-dependent methyltransferase [Planctomycetota bacterium]
MAATRWEKAQEYEKAYWKGVAERIAKGVGNQLTWYRNNAAKYKQLVVPHLRTPPDRVGEVVEVGSGPIGIATFFDLGRRHAVDPLADYYAQYGELSNLRDRSVQYVATQGEKLPFPDLFADLVIIENVLDHTQRPDLVMEEIRRILKPDGTLFFKVNIRTPLGTKIHRVLSRTGIDKGHPHSYSHASIRRTLEHHGFEIRWEHVDDYATAKKNDLASKRGKDRMKGVLGISEFWYTAVCWKR